MFGQRARLKRPCSMSKPSPLLQGLSCRRGQFLDNEHGHFFPAHFSKMDWKKRLNAALGKLNLTFLEKWFQHKQMQQVILHFI